MSTSNNAQYVNGQLPQSVNLDRSTLKRPFPSDVEHSSKRRAPTASLSDSDDGRTIESTASDEGLTLKSTESDDSRTLKSRSIAGHHIACFVVGGEPRLCLPQLLRLMVDRVDVDLMESARRKLSINLAQCDHDQLAALLDAKALPPSASSCGLVTLSDAARLVSGLSECVTNDDVINRHRKWAWLLSDNVTDHRRKSAWWASDDIIDRDQNWTESAADDCKRLPVCHSCFGGCTGMLIRRHDVRVRCDHCSAVMSPEVFVTHSHRLDSESRGTCHWGFDAARWRHYVMLNSAAATATSPEVTRRLQAALDDVKRLRRDEFPVKQLLGCRQVNNFPI